MSKKLIERFDPPKDWDFEVMLYDYGQEYLSENDNEREVFDMSSIDDIYDEPLEAITRAFYGGRHGFKNDSFNPNDDFFTYNGYGNLISIPYLEDYLKDTIDEESFYDWCVEEGYFESNE